MAHPLIAYEWLYGLTECLHIVGFTLAVGSIALVDLQLAGLGFPGSTPAAILGETTRWTLIGIVLASLSGLLLISTDQARYLAHPTMLAKLGLFGAAIVFNYTWHRRAARSAPGAGSRIVALASLTAWVLVVFGGLFYAFT